MSGSWRTTVLGWLVLVGSVCNGLSALIDNDPKTTLNYEAIVTALAGVGLIASQDAKGKPGGS